jgi:predicted lipoprotein
VYVDQTILPTYEDMKNKAWTLYDCVEALGTDITDAKIAAACDAWRATRIPWEQSEAFLFGPAENHNLDPLLDSWPLDQSGIESVLNGGKYDPSLLGQTVRGFHTIEYLIFEGGNARTVQTFVDGAKRYEYLLAVSTALRDDCIKLWSSWAGIDALKGKDLDAMEEIEFTPVSPSYASQFKNAGKAGSVYMSQSEAIDALVDGCMTIADEVSAQKIGGPNGLAKAGNIQQAVLDVESWYSWNSITDYANNIESIRNSYLGGREGNRGASLSAYIKSKDAAMDAEIIAAIETAYKAIKNDMKAPFRNNLTGAEVDAAIQACANLETTIEKVKTLKK